jgi:hypothetical protein
MSVWLEVYDISNNIIDYDRVDRTIYWYTMKNVRLSSDMEIVTATVEDQIWEDIR